ncbi:unnamed protein product [Rotaria sp. Silwood2]|nr:unnamed protein product [Rotaria sp. Silwood2]
MIYLVTYNEVPGWIPNYDFRQWAAAYFRALKTFCSVAIATVSNIPESFLSSISVNNKIILKDEFDRQMNVTMQHLQTTMPSTFMQALTLIQITGQGNSLINVFSTNWYFTSSENQSNMTNLESRPVINLTILHVIDGLQFGCTILESLLLSSLECFYSSACIQALLDAMPLGNGWHSWQYDTPPN